MLGNQTVIQAHAEEDLSMLLTNLGYIYVFGSCYSAMCGVDLHMQNVTVPTLVNFTNFANMTLNVTTFSLGPYSVFF